jgi:hypothetical protein
MAIKKSVIKPQMFSDEPAEVLKEKAKKITDFKNFGPMMEKIFLKAGIKTPAQFIKLGWKKTMIKIGQVDPKFNHSMVAYTVIGALQNKMWNAISEDDKLQAREFMKSIREKNAAKPKKKSSKRRNRN